MTFDDFYLSRKIDDKVDVTQRCSPLTLVHVSKHWRAVGMQLHSIWSFIRVRDSTPLSKIRFWLDQSGNHPLCIVIEDVQPTHLLNAYDLLVPHANRWSEFWILAGRSSYAPPGHDWHLVPFLTLTNSHGSDLLLSAPMLRVLHLQKRVSMTMIVETAMNYPSFSSSTLKKLTVARINLEWSHLGQTMAFSTITDLEVDQAFHHVDTNLRLMQSISQMTALKYLRAELMFLLHPITEIAMESIAYPVTLPNLQELSLRISGPSTAFWAWMINLNAPRLWHLFLQHYIPNLDDHNDEEQEQEQQGQAELAGLRTRIRLPSLTHFHCQLEPARWSGGSKNFDLIAFMPAIATVSHITLFSWSGTRTLLAFLTFNCTFPHLEHVKFLVDVDDPGEEERMLSEAIARLNPNATFTLEDY